jgi:chemotaxis protein MotB
MADEENKQEEEQEECEECQACPPGAPMWMATFSDMMTLLLTFFVLLLSMANMDPIKMEVGTESVSSALASINFFSTRDIVGEPKPELVIVPSPVIRDKVSKDRSPTKKKKQENKDDDNKQKSQKEKNEAESQRQSDGESADAVSMEAQKEINEIQKNMQMSFKEEIAKGAINFKSEKERIVIEYPADDSFKSGSDQLTDKMKRVTQQISFLLQDKNVFISISGYTDSIPIRTAKFRNNWDLSVMRASSVANEMLRFVDFAPEQLEVKGYGEGHPKASNATREGRKQNRRLEIVVEPAGPDESVMEGATIDPETGEVIPGEETPKPLSSDTVNKERLLERIR